MHKRFRAHVTFKSNLDAQQRKLINICHKKYCIINGYTHIFLRITPKIVRYTLFLFFFFWPGFSRDVCCLMEMESFALSEIFLEPTAKANERWNDERKRVVRRFIKTNNFSFPCSLYSAASTRLLSTFSSFGRGVHNSYIPIYFHLVCVYSGFSRTLLSTWVLQTTENIIAAQYF